MLTPAGVRPERHIKEQCVAVSPVHHLINLRMDKRPVFRVIGATEPVPGGLGCTKIVIGHPIAVDTAGKAVGLQHLPFGMVVVLPGIVDQTVVAADADIIGMTQLDQAPDLIRIVLQRLVHGTRLCRIIAQSRMRLQIDHGIIDVCLLQVFHIGFR